MLLVKENGGKVMSKLRKITAGIQAGFGKMVKVVYLSATRRLYLDLE